MVSDKPSTSSFVAGKAALREGTDLPLGRTKRLSRDCFGAQGVRELDSYSDILFQRSFTRSNVGFVRS